MIRVHDIEHIFYSLMNKCSLNMNDLYIINDSIEPSFILFNEYWMLTVCLHLSLFMGKSTTGLLTLNSVPKCQVIIGSKVSKNHFDFTKVNRLKWVDEMVNSWSNSCYKIIHFRQWFRWNISYLIWSSTFAVILCQISNIIRN